MVHLHIHVAEKNLSTPHLGVYIIAIYVIHWRVLVLIVGSESLSCYSTLLVTLVPFASFSAQFLFPQIFDVLC